MSLSTAAPASSARAATSRFVVSIERGTGNSDALSTTGPIRCHSSRAVTGAAPGRDDSPPTSMRSAPSSTRRHAWSSAAPGSRCRPPSEKESGVTLSTPRMSGRSSGRIPVRIRQPEGDTGLLPAVKPGRATARPPRSPLPFGPCRWPGADGPRPPARPCRRPPPSRSPGAAAAAVRPRVPRSRRRRASPAPGAPVQCSSSRSRYSSRTFAGVPVRLVQDPLDLAVDRLRGPLADGPALAEVAAEEDLVLRVSRRRSARSRRTSRTG